MIRAITIISTSCPTIHGADLISIAAPATTAKTTTFYPAAPAARKNAADARVRCSPAAPAAAPPAPAAVGGIRGTITKKTGNWMPPVDRNRAKETPLSGVQVQIFQGDVLRATLVSDHDGRFSINLPPGQYTVIIKGGGNANHSGKVEVKDGQWVEIDACDKQCDANRTK